MGSIYYGQDNYHMGLGGEKKMAFQPREDYESVPIMGCIGQALPGTMMPGAIPQYLPGYQPIAYSTSTTINDRDRQKLNELFNQHIAKQDVESPHTKLKVDTDEPRRNTMMENVKGYFEKHKDVILTLGIVILVDHFLFKGALRNRIQSTVEGCLSKVEKALHKED